MKQAISQRAKKNLDKKGAEYMAIQMKYSEPKKPKVKRMYKVEKRVIEYYEVWALNKKEAEQMDLIDPHTITVINVFAKPIK